MEVSMFVVQLLALLFLSVSVAALRGKIDFDKVVHSFQSSPGLSVMTGMISMAVGLYLVKYHNIWAADLRVVATIVGWGALIKGVMYTAFSDKLTAFRPMFKNTKGKGMFLLIVGLLLGYYSFIA